MRQRLWNLVRPEARPRFLALAVVVSVGGLVELLGISTIAEFMGVAATPKERELPGGLLSWIHQQSGAPAEDRLLVALAGTTLVLAFVHAFHSLSVYLRAQFVWLQERELTTTIFAATLKRPYSWFLTRNTGRLHRLLAASHVTQRLIDGVLSSIAKLAVVLTLGLALLWTDPLVAVVSGVTLAVIYRGVLRMTRYILREKGGLAHSSAKEREQLTQEAMVGIRFVKTASKEPFFIERYKNATEVATRSGVFHSIYTDVTRALLEWVAFVGLLCLCYYLTRETQDVVTLLPQLTLYSMACYRLIPAVHELFQLRTRMHFDQVFISEIEEMLDYAETQESLTQKELPDLEECEILARFEDVSFRYEGAERLIFDSLNWELKKGEWIGVVGATGVGKTTLLDLLVGLCTPIQGQVLVGGTVLEPEHANDWRRRLGVVPQDVILLDDTLANNVAFGLEQETIDREKIERVCQAAGLAPFLARLPEGLESQMGERGVRISGGERQRVGLARALYTDPLLLLLDEATSSLDQATEARIVETFKELSGNCTLVTVAHRLSSVKPCDRILVLGEEGIVAEGTFEELLETSPEFRRLNWMEPKT